MENYTLMNDRVVKKLFTSTKVGKRYSAAVIANVLNLDEEDVYNNLEYIHPEISSNASIVNSTADTVYISDKTYIDIEFNMIDGPSNRVKNEAYIVHLYLRQLKNHKDYKNLKKVIQINIDNFDFYGKNKFLYHSMMMELKLHLIENESIEIYHINLPNLRKLDYNVIVTDGERLKKILYILICEDKEKLDGLYKGDDLMLSLQEEAKEIAEEMKTWPYFDRDEILRIDREDAVQEGFNEGHEQGKVSIFPIMGSSSQQEKMSGNR